MIEQPATSYVAIATVYTSKLQWLELLKELICFNLPLPSIDIESKTQVLRRCLNVSQERPHWLQNKTHTASSYLYDRSLAETWSTPHNKEKPLCCLIHLSSTATNSILLDPRHLVASQTPTQITSNRSHQLGSDFNANRQSWEESLHRLRTSKKWEGVICSVRLQLHPDSIHIWAATYQSTKNTDRETHFTA